MGDTNRNCICGKYKPFWADRCNICMIESMTTYAESREQLLAQLNYGIMATERAIFEDLHPDLYTTKTKG